MTKEERVKLFFDKCKEKYDDYFDYSKAVFVNQRTPITIIDKTTGRSFERIPELHLRYDDRGFFEREKIKPYRYWHNKDVCQEECQKYRNITELQTHNYGAYKAAKDNGWLYEFFENKRNEVVYRDYNSKIHCVYVYEIPQYNTCYVGRTLRLKIRDRQHRNGVLRHGVKEYDNLYKFCNEKGIEIPKPKVLIKGIDAPESQRQEGLWVDYYRNDGWVLINKASTGDGIGSLGSVVKWTYEKCKEEAQGCKNKEAFKKKNQSAHNAARKNGWLNDFFQQKKKPNGWWDNFEHCQEEALKWRNVKDFALHGGGAYNASIKNKWLHNLEFKNGKE